MALIAARRVILDFFSLNGALFRGAAVGFAKTRVRIRDVTSARLGSVSFEELIYLSCSRCARDALCGWPTRRRAGDNHTSERTRKRYMASSKNGEDIPRP